MYTKNLTYIQKIDIKCSPIVGTFFLIPSQGYVLRSITSYVTASFPSTMKSRISYKPFFMLRQLLSDLH